MYLVNNADNYYKLVFCWTAQSLCESNAKFGFIQEILPSIVLVVTACHLVVFRNYKTHETHTACISQDDLPNSLSLHSLSSQLIFWVPGITPNFSLQQMVRKHSEETPRNKLARREKQIKMFLWHIPCLPCSYFSAYIQAHACESTPLPVSSALLPGLLQDKHLAFAASCSWVGSDTHRVQLLVSGTQVIICLLINQQQH